MTARAIAIISALVCALLCDSAGLAAESAVTEHVLAATVEQEVVASDLRIGGDDKQTRFVVDLNRKIDFAAFTLADPYRVVVDLPQVNFKLPAKAGTQSRGLIKAFRYGLIMQGGSRIVLDAKGPVRIEKAFVLDAAEGQPARLVLDLAAIDRAAFMRNISLQTRPAHNTGAKPSEPSVKADGDARPLIVVDPGHGGIDNGTKGSGGELEKDIVLAFSQALREKLESGGKYRVAMTRVDDSLFNYPSGCASRARAVLHFSFRFMPTPCRGKRVSPKVPPSIRFPKPLPTPRRQDLPRRRTRLTSLPAST